MRESRGVTGERGKAFADFHEHYKKCSKMDVPLHAPYGYDAVNTTAAAMFMAASPDPRRYLSEPAKIEHEGMTGPSAFDKNGDIRDGTLALYTYRNGEKSKLAVVQ